MRDIKKRSIFIILMVLSLFSALLFGISISSNAVSAAEKAAQVAVVTEENRDVWLNTPIRQGSEETFAPESRRFQGIPSVVVTETGRVWVLWQTGGVTEPDPQNLNYFVAAFSDDGGKSWNDPAILIYHDTARLMPYAIWLNEDGELFLGYSHNSANKWLVVVENPDAPLKDLRVRGPFDTGMNILALNKPTLLKNGEWLTAGRTPGNNASVSVYSSKDKGYTWQFKGTFVSNVEKTAPEPMIVQHNDGSLEMLCRVEKGENGGVEAAVSLDNGFSWVKKELPSNSVFVSPGSRFYYGRLTSGNLIFCTNNSTSARSDLTVYLSEDDGETWSDGLILDDRAEVSYPDIAQDGDGNIYIVYDKGRTLEKEIRLSVVTEEEIKSGYLILRDRIALPIAKDNAYADIVSVENAKGFISVLAGTDRAKVLASLPETLKVKGSDGETYELEGKWRCNDYDSSAGAVNRIEFNTVLPLKLQDPKQLLKIYAVVEEGKSGGCSSSVSGNFWGCLLLMPCIFCVALKRVGNRKHISERKHA